MNNQGVLKKYLFLLGRIALSIRILNSRGQNILAILNLADEKLFSLSKFGRMLYFEALVPRVFLIAVAISRQERQFLIHLSNFPYMYVFVPLLDFDNKPTLISIGF